MQALEFMWFPSSFPFLKQGLSYNLDITTVSLVFQNILNGNAKGKKPIELKEGKVIKNWEEDREREVKIEIKEKWDVEQIFTV